MTACIAVVSGKTGHYTGKYCRCPGFVDLCGKMLPTNKTGEDHPGRERE